MTCRQADEFVQQGLDGTLTPAERDRLDRHLASCANCRLAWDEHLRLARLARRWVPQAGRIPQAGDAFTAQVLARIAARPAPAPARPAFWLPLAAAALLVAALPLLPRFDGLALPDVMAALRALPGWLTGHGQALPSDVFAAWATVKSNVQIPNWIGSAVLAAGTVNGLFYLRAAHARERSLR